MFRILGIAGLIMLSTSFVAADNANTPTAEPTALPSFETPRAAFAAAQPVWLSGRETELNVFAGFRAQFDAPATGTAILRLTGSTVYRAFINGEFAGYGPARGPHGYYRVDEWDITPLIGPGHNQVAIEVAGYYMNSFYTLKQPSFLQAEIVTAGHTLVATSADNIDNSDSTFQAFELPWRRQKIQRISFMRAAAEAYDMQPSDHAWRVGGQTHAIAQPLETVDTKQLLHRGVTYPLFTIKQPVAYHGAGTVIALDKPTSDWRDRSLVNIDERLNGYTRDELELNITDEFLKHPDDTATTISEQYQPNDILDLAALDFREFDFGRILTGFTGLDVECTTPTRLVVTFDETLTNDHVYPLRQGMVNGLIYDLQPGRYSLEQFEPFTYQYLRVATYSGSAAISNIRMREYANDDVWTAQFRSSDTGLNTLFEAGRETFRQNALDTFMDCPSRERAGYLCDSFFTARAAAELCPNMKIEDVFFENYLLPETFEFIPDGMLPMSYPSDSNKGIYIPQWAMWFVVQLDEYSRRTADQSIVLALRPRVEKLLAYLAEFENSDGLLEKLPGWNFLEWSKSQEWMQDVNYPTNMLYAQALEIAGRLYDTPAYADKAGRIRKTVVEQSFDGQFFVDNAVRTSGTLDVTDNHSEMCQYFAFFFNAATPESHPELWHRLLTDFGPHRKDTGKWPEVAPANAFIGNVVRLELLSRAGLHQKVMEEAIGYYLYQAEWSGTLWEMVGPTNSMNHGFASHICHLLNRDVLGVAAVDHNAKTVKVHIPDTGLQWCSGRIPGPDGFITLDWQRDGDSVKYKCEVPAGYTLDVGADKGLVLVLE